MNIVRKQLLYDRKAVSQESGVKTGPGKTLQSQKDESDINVIMKRFGATGLVPMSIRQPLLSDFGTLDFQGAMNAIVEAKKSFMQLPADVRYRFGNDPGSFVKFCSDPSNGTEMRKLGIRAAEPVIVEEKPIRVIMDQPIPAVVTK